MRLCTVEKIEETVKCSGNHINKMGSLNLTIASTQNLRLDKSYFRIGNKVLVQSRDKTTQNPN